MVIIKKPYVFFTLIRSKSSISQHAMVTWRYCTRRPQRKLENLFQMKNKLILKPADMDTSKLAASYSDIQPETDNIDVP